MILVSYYFLFAIHVTGQNITADIVNRFNTKADCQAAVERAHLDPEKNLCVKVNIKLPQP